MKTNEIYSEITDAIVEALKSGVRPWECCYRFGLPTRANGETYQGINILQLWMKSSVHGYNSSTWMTFKQAKEVGANVKRGEKGARVIYYKSLEKDNPDNSEEPIVVPMLKSYMVFNLDQIENLPEKFTVTNEENQNQPIATAEAFFDALPTTVKSITGVPCFVPAKDEIRMPSINHFKNEQVYYATYGHECVHWTGHKKRLDRFGDSSKKAYAFEELIAEIGSAFLLPQMGIEPLIDEEHAPYISGFIKVLEDDPKAIFRAASQAQKATNYLLDRVSETEMKKAA